MVDQQEFSYVQAEKNLLHGQYGSVACDVITDHRVGRSVIVSTVMTGGMLSMVGPNYEFCETRVFGGAFDGATWSADSIKVAWKLHADAIDLIRTDPDGKGRVDVVAEEQGSSAL